MLVKSQVKYIQSLSQKKVRDEEGSFVAEGPKIINELLGGEAVEAVTVYATPDWINTHKILSDRLPADGLVQVSFSELGRISFLSAPNEVLGVFKKPDFHGLRKIKKSSATDQDPGLMLALDSIQDPGNLGTIIRCADWFGVRKIIANPGTADNFNPKVVQSTMASIARVEVEYCDLAGYITAHPGLQVFAAALDGQPLTAFRSVQKGLLMIGNESKGISPALMELAMHRITIPRFGGAESLNAAVATGIILSAFRS